MKWLKLLKQLLPAILFFLGFYAILVVILQQVGLERAQAIVEGYGIWSPIIFVGICALSLIAAPLSASSLFIAGGAIFGRELGVLLSLLASILGCSANYWISKKLGRRVVRRLIGEDSLAELDTLTQGLKGHHSIFYMMLLMPLSQDIVSYAVGLTAIRYPAFFVALLSSGFAIVSAYIYLGTGLLEALLK
jgi:uncharacterized membrane protein YdjX (TVP38/TMEM64 family)